MPGIKLRILLWVVALILIGNFFVLRLFGDALRSTYLFVTRGTVFYPLAFLNLAAGAVLVIWLIVGLAQNKNKWIDCSGVSLRGQPKQSRSSITQIASPPAAGPQ